MTNEITIVDKFYINESIEKLKPVLANNDMFKELVLAYKIPIEHQEWAFVVLKESGLYKIFETFPVLNSQINIIKSFILYDNNPTLANLGKMLLLVFGADVLIENLTGEVRITIPANPFELPLSYTTDGIDDIPLSYTTNGIDDIPLTYLLSPTSVIGEVNLYFIRHFIPAGVKLTLVF